jgi:hypothetical protein
VASTRIGMSVAVRGARIEFEAVSRWHRDRLLQIVSAGSAPEIRGPTIMNPASPSVMRSSPLIPSLTASRRPTARTANQTQVGPGMKLRKTSETNTIAKPMTLPPAWLRTALAIFTRRGVSLPGRYRRPTLRT